MMHILAADDLVIRKSRGITYLVMMKQQYRYLHVCMQYLCVM